MAEDQARPTTPSDDLRRQRLPRRVEKALLRAGITSVAAIQGMSDRQLLALRDVGPKRLAVLRAALTGHAAPMASEHGRGSVLVLADNAGRPGAYRKEASLVVPDLYGGASVPLSEAKVCLAMAQKPALQHGGAGGDQRIFLEAAEMDALVTWWGQVRKAAAEGRR